MGRAEDLYEKLKLEGEKAIDEFILIRQVEHLCLDFKRSADNGNGPKVLHQNDRNHLAKAISGFGNSEGGVIIWGTDASGDVDGADVAKAKHPIENPKRFEGWLQGAVSGCTLPAHPHVEHHHINIGKGKGFVVTLISKSQLAPHQCVTDHKYYMRAGSSFQPVTHSIIAGMFGRRPQPWLFANFTLHLPEAVNPGVNAAGAKLPRGIKAGLTLMIANKGPGVARDLFSTVKFTAPGPQCQHWFDPPNDNWIRQDVRIKGWQSVVSKDGYKLAPESLVNLCTINIVLIPPFKTSLCVEMTFGSGASPTMSLEHKTSTTKVDELYHEFFDKTPKDGQEGLLFARNLFSLPDTGLIHRNFSDPERTGNGS